MQHVNPLVYGPSGNGAKLTHFETRGIEFRKVLPMLDWDFQNIDDTARPTLPLQFLGCLAAAPFRGRSLIDALKYVTLVEVGGAAIELLRFRYIITGVISTVHAPSVGVAFHILDRLDLKCAARPLATRIATDKVLDDPGLKILRTTAIFSGITQTVQYLGPVPRLRVRPHLDNRHPIVVRADNVRCQANLVAAIRNWRNLKLLRLSPIAPREDKFAMQMIVIRPIQAVMTSIIESSFNPVKAGLNSLCTALAVPCSLRRARTGQP